MLAAGKVARRPRNLTEKPCPAEQAARDLPMFVRQRAFGGRSPKQPYNRGNRKAEGHEGQTMNRPRLRDPGN